MRTLKAFSAAAAVLFAAGCATMPEPAPLVADDEGKARLAGEWVGEYIGTGTGRAGSIVFSLVSHDSLHCGYRGQHAHGDVLMTPSVGAGVRSMEQLGEDILTREPQVLRFESIQVTGDHLTGTLEPYRDPDTDHPMSTVFDGAIIGDRIDGTFVSVDGTTGERYVGTWEVRRKTGT